MALLIPVVVQAENSGNAPLAKTMREIRIWSEASALSRCISRRWSAAAASALKLVSVRRKRPGVFRTGLLRC